MTKIDCNVGDAPRPAGDLPLLRLRNPHDRFDLAVGERNLLKSGVRFSVPVVLYGWQGTDRQKVVLVNAGTLVPAGQEVVADLKNEGDETAMFERGDSLLQVHPLIAGSRDKVEFKT